MIGETKDGGFVENQFEIKTHQCKLIVGPAKGEYLNVRFEGPGVAACVKVYLYTDAEYLNSYFDLLASEWKGWEGSILWQSVEDDLQFEAVHDNLGHVNLKVSLIGHQGTEIEWRLTGRLNIELGLLDGIAMQIRTVLNVR